MRESQAQQINLHVFRSLDSMAACAANANANRVLKEATFVRHAIDPTTHSPLIEQIYK